MVNYSIVMRSNPWTVDVPSSKANASATVL